MRTTEGFDQASTAYPDARNPYLGCCTCAGLRERVHFWPFDGWQIPVGRSALVEVYPALWKHAYASEGRTPDQHDAYSVAVWLHQADLDAQLSRFLTRR